LYQNKIPFEKFTIHGEPTINAVSSGTVFARTLKCDLVIGVGGGSVLDASKAIAILATNEGDIFDYLEVIGKGKSFVKPCMPLILIPTTAGTGAEVTRNAVIAAQDQRVKVSLRSPHIQAKMALVDPELSYSMPPGVTASTGMDALTQLVEPYVSNKATPITDALCQEGIARCSSSLLRAYHHADDPVARENMALASLMSGIALANAKLGVVHGIASVIGGMFDAPHGAICARLLPAAMDVNIKALETRGKDHQIIQRYDRIAQIVCKDLNAKAIDGVRWVRHLAELLAIPPLSKYEIQRTDFPAIIEKSAIASSTKGNPIELSFDEIGKILDEAV
jgi:alcohol dehydrogenase class IV